MVGLDWENTQGQGDTALDEEEFRRLLEEGCEKALAAGDVRSSQLKRSREVFQRAEEESVPDHVWKRFSPEVVDHTE